MIKEYKHKDREEWLKFRKDYIGGSEAGAVVGMSTYASPYSVWAEKTGRAEGFEGNITTRVGSYLEALVAEMFTEETGKKVRKKTTTMVNDKYPWACADVDRLIVGENAVLEIKTTNSLPNMKKFANGEYPDTWYCQMTHYMAVGGFKKAYLAVLVGCRDFMIFELERNEDEINALMIGEERFWQHVKDDTPPVADGLPATTSTLGTIYSETTDDDIDLTGYDDVFRSLAKIKEQIDDLEKLKVEQENKVKDALKNATFGHSIEYKCSWKESERKTFDVSRFSKDHPNIDLTDYYKTASYRIFKYSEAKKNKGEER